jgi:hypothetical protein
MSSFPLTKSIIFQAWQTPRPSRGSQWKQLRGAFASSGSKKDEVSCAGMPWGSMGWFRMLQMLVKQLMETTHFEAFWTILKWRNVSEPMFMFQKWGNVGETWCLWGKKDEKSVKLVGEFVNGLFLSGECFLMLSRWHCDWHPSTNRIRRKRRQTVGVPVFLRWNVER